MTRAEIISYCLAKIAVNDATSQAVAAQFFDARHATIWNDSDWRQARWQQNLTIVAGTQDYQLAPEFEFVKVARWDGAYDVPLLNDTTALMRNPAGYDTSGPITALIPLARTGAGVCQIRCVQNPTQNGTLLIIGKKKITALASGDTPPIPGEDVALCEFVTGDLYEWLRQFDTAAYFFQKGGIQLDKMREMETAQAGELRQIIPYTQELEGGSLYDSMRPLG
ncbi:MAG: hypothetical protein B9S38_02480 [Verrucomicrobiia bacterium Tous-C4TDCM]|nr:MAG: hypothetical protein B9S38_02480 [Verrucomicrobiae bacterium Tous-C4TDCM]